MTPITPIISLGLIIFWGVSLQNVLKNRDTWTGNSDESPMGTAFLLALFGSLSMFAESLAVIALDYRAALSVQIGLVTGLGLSLFFIGCVLHAWSVAVRGRYAISWGMPEGQKLITDAPYSFVRHPSYLGYMLMIVGITLLWQQWFTLLPWVALYGYYNISKTEEALLLKQFGEEYISYMKKVGAFIPRI
jgi:protein-S-isoprenylcysteine O-methyltransferase Ste14